MNFYLDFEATQFSERIISVGCVASNGKSFYSLVNPGEKKVNKFITELTGITQEMVANAPSADEVFLEMRNFVRDEANSEETFFFTYGDADSVFIERTAKDMKDQEARQFALNLGASFIDYSKITCKFFHVNSVSLKKVVAYFRGEPIIQNHNALEDAEMLREIAIAIAHSDCPAESPWGNNANTNTVKEKNSEDKSKNFPIRMTKENGDAMEFINRTAARDWVYEHLFSKKQRTKGEVSKKNITRRLNRCLNGTDQTYFKYKWEYIIEEKENDNNE